MEPEKKFMTSEGNQMDPNPLYEEFDKLITKEQLEYFLDEWWRLYPRIYKNLHRKSNGVAYRMLELFMDSHSGLFNTLMTRTLRR